MVYVFPCASFLANNCGTNPGEWSAVTELDSVEAVNNPLPSHLTDWIPFVINVANRFFICDRPFFSPVEGVRTVQNLGGSPCFRGGAAPLFATQAELYVHLALGSLGEVKLYVQNARIVRTKLILYVRKSLRGQVCCTCTLRAEVCHLLNDLFLPRQSRRDARLTHNYQNSKAEDYKR